MPTKTIDYNPSFYINKTVIMFPNDTRPKEAVIENIDNIGITVRYTEDNKRVFFSHSYGVTFVFI